MRETFDMINICFITDEKYVLPTLVSIKSLIVNSKTPLSISVVTNVLSENSKQLYEQLETSDAKINVIYAQNPCTKVSINHDYITKTVYLKFALPDIFKDLDKILYIDGDTLILDDLKEFYDIDLGDNYAGVIEDICVSTTQTYYKEEGLKKYFNAGVMLMNLAKIRQESTIDKLVEYARNGKHQLFLDQDAFNFIFNEKVVWLPLKYNYLNKPYNEEFLTYHLNISPEEYRKIADSITIHHYAGVIMHKMLEFTHGRDLDLWFKYFNMLIEDNYQGENATNLGLLCHKFQNNAILTLNNRIDNLQHQIYQLNNNNNKKENILQKIFSVKNRDGHKVVTILFIKMKFKKEK